MLDVVQQDVAVHTAWTRVEGSWVPCGDSPGSANTQRNAQVQPQHVASSQQQTVRRGTRRVGRLNRGDAAVSISGSGGGSFQIRVPNAHTKRVHSCNNPHRRKVGECSGQGWTGLEEAL